MDIRKYEVLLHALDRGNMSQAAVDLDYTQSGISHMMKSLEDHFGFPILARNRLGITLTKNGEDILPYIRNLVKSNEAMQQKASDLKGIYDGRITVGAFSSVCSSWLLPVMHSFHSDYSHIQICLTNGTSARLEKKLMENQLDIGFFSHSDNKALNCLPLKDDPLLAVLPSQFASKYNGVFPISAFQSHHFIIPSPDGECDSWSIVKQFGIPMEHPFTAPDTYTAVAMVANGLGFSLVPELVLKTTNYSNVVALPLAPPLLRKLCMVTPASSNASPAAKKFSEYCVRIIPDLCLSS